MAYKTEFDCFILKYIDYTDLATGLDRTRYIELKQLTDKQVVDIWKIINQ